MKVQSTEFLLDDQMDWEELGGGVSRKIYGYDDKIMMVKVKFDKGAEGTPHEHFHSQTTYVVSGKFNFDIGEVSKVVNGGDGIYIHPNVVHGAQCLEEGMLIDVFSPVREDFLDGSAVSYFGNKDDK